jgi:hypothetical protein
MVETEKGERGRRMEKEERGGRAVKTFYDEAGLPLYR